MATTMATSAWSCRSMDAPPELTRSHLARLCSRFTIHGTRLVTDFFVHFPVNEALKAVFFQSYNAVRRRS